MSGIPGLNSGTVSVSIVRGRPYEPQRPPAYESRKIPARMDEESELLGPPTHVTAEDQAAEMHDAILLLLALTGLLVASAYLTLITTVALHPSDNLAEGFGSYFGACSVLLWFPALLVLCQGMVVHEFGLRTMLAWIGVGVGMCLLVATFAVLVMVTA